MTVGTDQRALDELCVNTIRTLSMDAVQKANSGHPGTPMALAPIAYVLYTRVMRHAPERPGLAGPRPLRALLRPRVDAPLLDAATSRATASRSTTSRTSASSARRAPATPSTATRRASRPPPARSARASRPRSAWRSPSACSPRASTATATTIVDHYTYVIASDGDLEEGIASEASSLAGHLGLGQPDRASTTTTTSRSRATPRSRSPRTSASATRPTAGTCRTSARTSSSTASRRRCEAAQSVDRPARALIIVPHAHRARLAEQAGHRTARTARRSARRRSGSPRRSTAGPSQEPFFVPDEALDALPRVRRPRRASSQAEWERALRGLPRRAPERGRRARAHARRPSCPTAGTPTSRRKGPDAGMIATRKASQRGHPVGGRRRCPSWSAARPTSRRRR